MKLDIRAIAKDFGSTAALHGVDLEVASGELVALLGPSGSGKTTLLRIIAGLDFPTRGQVLFGGADASLKSVQERNVGFVFQHYALFKHMTVADNIAFGLRARPRDRRPDAADIARRVETLLDLVQLGGYGPRYPSQLSGGQRQRIALARALAIEPQVLLLDEPFGALDAKVRKELRRWLRELHDKTGHTTLFVTHDQEEALDLADRVVVMSNGRIEQVGSPEDVYDRPATPFVFDFIGEAARIPVEVAGGVARLGGNTVPVVGGRRGRRMAAGCCTCGRRTWPSPEKARGCRGRWCRCTGPGRRGGCRCGSTARTRIWRPWFRPGSRRRGWGRGRICGWIGRGCSRREGSGICVLGKIIPGRRGRHPPLPNPPPPGGRGIVGGSGVWCVR